MSQWPVAEFVSRVAERVSWAGEEFAGGLIDRGDDDLVNAGSAYLRMAFAMVEPSPEFVAELDRQLREATPVPDAEVAPTTHNLDRRIVYGVAMGSLASAAVAAALIFRHRYVSHQAA